MGVPVVDDRAGQLELLRSYGAISPYARKGRRRDKRKFPEEISGEQNEYDMEEGDRRHVDEIAETAYEEYPESPLNQWVVTLRSGSQMFAYTNDRGADEISAEGFPVRRVDDDTMVSLANVTDEARSDTPIFNSLQSPSTLESKRRPRLPRRRMGQHTAGEPVADLGQQRRKLPRSSVPPPGGGSVSPLPRHRRRE
jgi:hypothetical protein